MNSFHILLHVFAGLAALDVRGTAAVSCTCGYGPSGEGCVAQGFDDDHDAISLLQKTARVVLYAGLASNSSSKLEAASIRSKGAALPIILIVLAMAGLIAFSYFIMMMRDTADSDKHPLPYSSPQQPLRNPALGQHAPVLQQPPQLRSSPGAQALLPHASLPRNSPPQASLPPALPRNSPPQITVPPQPGAAATSSSTVSTNRVPHSGATHSAASSGADIARVAEPQVSAEPVQVYQKSPMTSTAIIVRSREGVILHSDNKLVPHAEQLLVGFRSIKGANSVVRARVEEFGPRPQITVESASGIPLATIDTSCAIYNPSFDAPPPDSRRANIHRVAGSSFQLLGQPCATVLSVARDTYVVVSAITSTDPREYRRTSEQLKLLCETHGFATRSDVLLTVKCDGSNGDISEMRDRQGAVVARQEDIGQQGHNVWVSHGADITLIVSVVLAVWKLV